MTPDDQASERDGGPPRDGSGGDGQDPAAFRTRVKVCGRTSPAEVAAAAAAGADAIGVITDVPVDSPRAVPVGRAVDLVAAAPPFVSSVLVTMPATPEAAVDLVERVRPDALQVHGSLAPGDLAYLAGRVDADVLATVDPADPGPVERIGAIVDALVVDTPGPGGAGGTGRTHDWDASRAVAERVDAPVVLAGGLTPENVASAIAAVGPHAVDVASGVESAPGVSDPELVRAFVAAAHGRRRVSP